MGECYISDGMERGNLIQIRVAGEIRSDVERDPAFLVAQCGILRPSPTKSSILERRVDESFDSCLNSVQMPQSS